MTTYKLIYPESYNRRARKFLTRHPELTGQYTKALKLLEIDPFHTSLRLHALSGKLAELHAISINLTYRITLEFTIRGKEIVLVNVGDHDTVYKK